VRRWCAKFGQRYADSLRRHRDKAAAKRSLRRLMKTTRTVPRVIVTNKHRSHKGLNNRAENSHQPTRQHERAMKGFHPQAERCGSCPRSAASHPTSDPNAT
jgi:transposase-like protein